MVGDNVVVSMWDNLESILDIKNNPSEKDIGLFKISTKIIKDLYKNEGNPIVQYKITTSERIYNNDEENYLLFSETYDKNRINGGGVESIINSKIKDFAESMGYQVKEFSDYYVFEPQY